VKLRLIQEGQAFTIFAVDTGRATDFHIVEADWEGREPDWSQLWARIDNLAERGPIFDNKKYRPLGHGIFEIKTKREGFRVPFFYCGRGVVVFTHAFAKGEPTDREIDRAKQIRSAVVKAVTNDDYTLIAEAMPRRLPSA